MNSSDQPLNTPILVMDSGVGGLSIVQEIQRLSPERSVLYLADNAAFPYGDKSESWLVERVVALALALVHRYPIQLMVLGCNTASTVVLPALRAALNIPVVGVVPAIKPAAYLSKTKHIGLLATPGTVTRSYTDQLITNHAEHCQVSRLGTTEVVKLAEDKLAGRAVDLDRLLQAVQPLFQVSSIDTIVLGCTHFPLLKAELEQISPRPITWVDSGSAIARRVEELLSSATLQKHKAQHKALLTAEVTLGSQLYQSLNQLGFDEVEVFEVSSLGALA
ncbi:glutamate racemase [Oceanospirillum multiglobuliferum]|uniref:Glutamate racemase n=1 Tax=Oceanospirillum multiglobuliferum TaxID=64969 RepID=A0A1T4LGQ6_9GAMM|nr:glutamate racemase [Oceanospirillum multiglobuliferum]OPX56669.1 glutamate racemase [Oceanospirillum multiglobuliferum]SJZ53751.1 glutamate racemase [Oceanospirillum multiglobuliferum]